MKHLLDALKLLPVLADLLGRVSAGVAAAKDPASPGGGKVTALEIGKIVASEIGPLVQAIVGLFGPSA